MHNMVLKVEASCMAMRPSHDRCTMQYPDTFAVRTNTIQSDMRLLASEQTAGDESALGTEAESPPQDGRDKVLVSLPS
jgi:hypothetical protein